MGVERNYSFRSGFYYTIVAANDLANVLAGEQRADGTGVKPSRLDPRTNGLLGFDRSAYAAPARAISAILVAIPSTVSASTTGM